MVGGERHLSSRRGIYKTKEEKDGMDRSKQATKRRETHLDEMNIDGRAILGIVSRMQQSLVHQDVFGPLDIHIQSIPKQTKPNQSCIEWAPACRSKE